MAVKKPVKKAAKASKPAVRKAPAKKAAARKPVAKKPVAKKVAAKKPAAKKPVPKKAPVKKAPAKKAAPAKKPAAAPKPVAKAAAKPASKTAPVAKPTATAPAKPESAKKPAASVSAPAKPQKTQAEPKSNAAAAMDGKAVKATVVQEQKPAKAIVAPRPVGKVAVAVVAPKPSTQAPKTKVKVIPYDTDETGRPILPKGYKPSPDEEYMGPLQTEYFRQRLLQWRADLVEESKQTIENLKDEVRDVGDEAERATRETENSLELRTRDRYRKLIGKIDSTLKRLEAGEYGFSVDSGEEIGLERLEARLTAERTIDEQERWEHLQKQIGD